MRYIFYIIGIAVTVALTFGLFNPWGWHGLVPNLLLLLIISVALAYNNLDFLFIGLVGGIWLDILFGLPIGSFAIPLILCGMLSSLAFQKWLFTDVTWKHFIIATILATLLLNAWLWGWTNLLFITGWSKIAIDGNQLLRNIVLLTLANILLAYPVYVIVELIAQSTSRLKRNKIKL